MRSLVQARTGYGGNSLEDACEQVERLLADLVLGALPADAEAAVQQHVGQCPACNRLLIITRYCIGAIVATDGEDPAPCSS